jgi:hypothetical protein
LSFYLCYKEKLKRPADPKPTGHQRYEWGCLEHTKQVTEKALSLNYGENQVNESDLVIVCLLHDFFNHDYEKTFRILKEFDIELTEEQKIAIYMAHGCWSRYNYSMNPLAFLLFISDTWSAKIYKL